MTSATYRLVMRQGPTPRQIYELIKPEIIIGRDMTNDIVINDAEVSRKHTRLMLEAGRYLVEDMGSTNGTFVNGQRLIGPHALSTGEMVMLGENVSLTFEAARPDLEATMVASAGELFSAPLVAAKPAYTPAAPQPVVSAQAPAPAVQPFTPAYSGQIPAGPDEYFPPIPAPKKKKATPWLLAGCSCLALVVIAVVAVLFVIDAMNLWCTIFGSLIPGC